MEVVRRGVVLQRRGEERGQGGIFGSENSKLMSNKGQRALTHTKGAATVGMVSSKRENELSWLSSRKANEQKKMTLTRE